MASGDDVLTVLDSQEPAVRRLVRNSGRALNAVNERRGQLRELIGNANDSFGALASRNESLAEAVFIFPTFLDESKATLRRLKTFARDTRPLVRDLEPVARDLAADAARRGQAGARPQGAVPQPRPADRRVAEDAAVGREVPPRRRAAVRGAAPLPRRSSTRSSSYLNFNQQQVADFITNGSGSLNATLKPLNDEEGPRHYLRAYSAINSRGVGIDRTRAELRPRQLLPGAQLPAPRAPAGIAEAFDCKPTGGEKKDATNGEPPCFVAPKSLFDGGQFPTLGRGEAPVRSNPPGNLGSEPATP